MSERSEPAERRAYQRFVEIPTRWLDNDIYGHVNNALYYSFFDTAIADLLMREGGLDPWKDDVVGFAVETGCRFFRPIAHPDILEVGLRIGRLGGSSVRYEIGIFTRGQAQAAAEGHFVHVFVERSSGRKAAIPAAIRTVFERLHDDRT